MDNLTDVWQAAQHRQFGHDSLGRLTSASNPEFGPAGQPQEAITYQIRQ